MADADDDCVETTFYDFSDFDQHSQNFHFEGLPGAPDPKSSLVDRQDLRSLPLERAGTTHRTYSHAVGG